MPTVQMNIRIGSDDRSAFQTMCKACNLTQQDGFLHLLSSSPLIDQKTKDELMDKRYLEQKNTIERQVAIIRDLRNKLSSPSRGQKADQKLKTAISNIKTAIDEYVHIVFPEPQQAPANCLSFKKSKTVINHQAYTYPKRADSTIFTFEHYCYGKGSVPAIFIFGEDENGNKIKLRLYAKREYMNLLRTAYAQPGSLWLIHYEPASDGAINVTLSLPLPDLIEPDDYYTPELDWDDFDIDFEEDNLDGRIAAAKFK